MVYQRLTTIDINGAAKGVVCNTQKCFSEYMSNGCQNCPIFKACWEHLKFFEDVYLAEDVGGKRYENTKSANNNSSRAGTIK
jgi:hypothetical protein